MPRLLFLDFDGVLHPLAKVELLHPHGWFCWLPVLVEILAPWTDVKVVVHSSWRTHFTDSELRQLLGSLAPRFVGSAPHLHKPLAIESVLKVNKSSVRAHVVLDDDARLLNHGALNLILCDPASGISAPDVQQKLVAWLNLTAPGQANGA